MRIAATLRAFIAASPSVLGFIGWVVASGLVAKSIPDAFHEHVKLAQVVVYGVAIIGGLGGLVGFWYSAQSIEFFVRRYRIRSVNRAQWVYGALPAVDLHHGEYSHDPPYSAVEVFGANLTPAIKEAFSQLGFVHFRECPGGFIATKMSVA